MQQQKTTAPKFRTNVAQWLNQTSKPKTAYEVRAQGLQAHYESFGTWLQISYRSYGTHRVVQIMSVCNISRGGAGFSCFHNVAGTADMSSENCCCEFCNNVRSFEYLTNMQRIKYVA